MKIRALVLAGLASAGLGGCGGTPQAENPEAVVRDFLRPTGEKRYHEWKEIWVGDLPAQRKRAGFLDRVYTEADPEGIVVVKDLLTAERGFLLPSGRALLVESEKGSSEKLRDLGLLSLEDAIRRTLGVAGAIELRTDLEASIAPKASSPPRPPAAGPASRSRATRP
ncbi:MAG: hypothetical protein ACUVYA_03365 [Planctomycetota bacterium]